MCFSASFPEACILVKEINSIGVERADLFCMISSGLYARHAIRLEDTAVRTTRYVALARDTSCRGISTWCTYLYGKRYAYLQGTQQQEQQERRERKIFFALRARNIEVVYRYRLADKWVLRYSFKGLLRMYNILTMILVSFLFFKN